MTKAGKYLCHARIALAVVLVVASSGFTMVLHSCLMEDMACCAPMAPGGPISTGSAASSEGAHVVRDASSCCENTVVGGLNPAAATLESQKAPVHQKIVLAAVSPEILDTQQRDCPSFVTLRHFRTPLFPPTAFYISNAALLI